MWWKKNSKKNHAWQEAVTDGFLQGCIFLQKKWTVTLGRITENWSNRAKRVFLAVVIVVLGGYSLYIFISTLTSDSHYHLPIKDVARAPVVPRSNQGNDNPLLSHSDTLKIRQFRKLLDSLRTTETGRKEYERFIQRHPGLLDSLEKVEQMMQQPFPF